MGYGSDIQDAVADLKESSSFEFNVYPALASNLECHLESIVIGSDATLSQVQTLAKELRESCAARPVDIVCKPTGAPLAENPTRLAVLEFPIGDDKKDGLSTVYSQMNGYQGQGQLVVFAKDDKAVVLLTDAGCPNPDVFQQRLSKALKRASMKAVFKDAWLLTV